MTSDKERTIDTMGITFTGQQMRAQRIKKICNVIVERGTDDFKPVDYISMVQEENQGRNIFDGASSGEYNVYSLIVFEDQYSKNVFGIRHNDYYGFHPDLAALYN